MHCRDFSFDPGDGGASQFFSNITSVDLMVMRAGKNLIESVVTKRSADEM